MELYTVCGLPGTLRSCLRHQMAMKCFPSNVPSMALSNSRTPPSLQLLLLLFHLLAIQIPLASPLSFNYSGTDLNFPNMIYQGDAFFDGDIVQLTKVQAHANLRRSSGRMVYPEPVTIYDEASVINFTSCFSFFIYGFKKVVSADGLAFFLSSYPSEIPELSCGGTLGLFTSPDGIITYPSTVVAVEFDTFFNPQYNDISANHIGIDVHTINSTVQLDLKTSLRRNTTFNACVDYKATTKNLSVFLTNASDPTRNWSLSHVVDLRKVLPAKVAIGFTAATGNKTEQQSLVSWNFSSSDLSSQGYGARPSHRYMFLGLGIGAAVLLCGLGTLLWFLRRRLGKKGAGNKEVDMSIDSNAIMIGH